MLPKHTAKKRSHKFNKWYISELGKFVWSDQSCVARDEMLQGDCLPKAINERYLKEYLPSVYSKGPNYSPNNCWDMYPPYHIILLFSTSLVMTPSTTLKTSWLDGEGGTLELNFDPDSLFESLCFFFNLDLHLYLILISISNFGFDLH